MIAMLGLELIGDDAEHRKRLRDGCAPSFRNIQFRRDPRRAFADEQRYRNRPRAWCARITGADPRYGLARQFLDGRRDYSEANSLGSRGVYRWFELPEGEVYEVSAPLSWTAADRYFCRSERGRIVRMTREEIDAWLAQRPSP